jgi:hypothetical protein
LNRVAGTISQVGGASCYTVVTDDGVAYALIGSGTTLSVGTWIRATFEPAPTRSVSCAGQPVAVVKLEVIG